MFALTWLVCLCYLSRSAALEVFSYDNTGNWKNAKNVDDNFYSKWDKLGARRNRCGDADGKKSPIDLRKTATCRSDHEMLIGRGKCSLSQVDWKIQPWGLEGHYPRTCKRPTVDLSDSFHMRHASLVRVKVPSEHTMEGKRFDGEVQVSHMDNALAANRSNRLEHVENISVFLDARSSPKKDNAWLEKMLVRWETEAKKQNARCGVTSATFEADLHFVGKRKNPISQRDQGLLPFATPDAPPPTNSTAPARRLRTKAWYLHSPWRNVFYYGYKGGLTQPPCTPNTFWYVSDEPQKISARQLDRVYALLAGYLDDDCELGTYADRDGSVARPVQNSRGAKVFHCDERDYLNHSPK
eukprot:CAMPEP_0194320296 /NCGR_PEP_ID=MMETSP0171-20130528/16635_1 /TAXON_ID=218684 /ORGANISM="Corethron pennatum, Strain L29A3" /LENGTH=353 /DNA_ID=CAMNT_0039077791 /DNA_START=133 /DNA_END=1194 /DNA_ORIENTATION=+